MVPATEVDQRQKRNRILTVSQDFFSTLGARFALGQSGPITGKEQDRGQAIVSGSFWNRIGGGRDLAGRSLNLDGRKLNGPPILLAA